MSWSRECAWCAADVIAGKCSDAGRPLTPEEASAGFLACHAECESKMEREDVRAALGVGG